MKSGADHEKDPPRFTVGWLMIAEAVVGVESGLACWLHRASINDPDPARAWTETFESWYLLHLLILFPVGLYRWGFDRTPIGRSKRRDEVGRF